MPLDIEVKQIAWFSPILNRRLQKERYVINNSPISLVDNRPGTVCIGWAQLLVFKFKVLLHLHELMNIEDDDDDDNDDDADDDDDDDINNR